MNIEENLSFLSLGQTKRRHISSMSKTMLAKRILDKIESENDPTNIAKALFQTSNSF